MCRQRCLANAPVSSWLCQKKTGTQIHWQIAEIAGLWFSNMVIRCRFWTIPSEQSHFSHLSPSSSPTCCAVVLAESVLWPRAAGPPQVRVIFRTIYHPGPSSCFRLPLFFGIYIPTSAFGCGKVPRLDLRVMEEWAALACGQCSLACHYIQTEDSIQSWKSLVLWEIQPQMQHVGHAVPHPTLEAILHFSSKKSATLPPSSVLEDCCMAGDLGSSAAGGGSEQVPAKIATIVCQVFDKPSHFHVF